MCFLESKKSVLVHNPPANIRADTLTAHLVLKRLAKTGSRPTRVRSTLQTRQEEICVVTHTRTAVD